MLRPGAGGVGEVRATGYGHALREHFQQEPSAVSTGQVQRPCRAELPSSVTSDEPCCALGPGGHSEPPFPQ